MHFVESWTNKHSQPLNCAIRQQWLNHRAWKTGILVSPIYNGCLLYKTHRLYNFHRSNDTYILHSQIKMMHTSLNLFTSTVSKHDKPLFRTIIWSKHFYLKNDYVSPLCHLLDHFQPLYWIYIIKQKTYFHFLSLSTLNGCVWFSWITRAPFWCVVNTVSFY